jgi:hypothetical protein
MPRLPYNNTVNIATCSNNKWSVTIFQIATSSILRRELYGDDALSHRRSQRRGDGLHIGRFLGYVDGVA